MTMDKPTKMNIMINIDKLENISADGISLEANNGYVIINFLQTIPGVNDEDNTETRNAKIASRICLSWNHFIRILPVMMNFAKENQAQIKSNYESTIKQLENMHIDKNE